MSLNINKTEIGVLSSLNFVFRQKNKFLLVLLVKNIFSKELLNISMNRKNAFSTSLPSGF